MTLNVLGGNVPSIVNPIPWGLIPQAGSFSSQYQLTDTSYDFAIAGIPFLSGESLRGTYFRRQYIEEFAPIRKDQFDNQQVPGEQSILGWWLRSQSNFSQGAGIQYLDTSVDQTLAQRYYYSEHMDTLSIPGSIQLTQATKQVLASANTNLHVRGVSISGVDFILVADGAVLKQINAAGTVTSYTMPAAITNIVTLTDDGTNYYFADTTGVWKGVIGVTGVAATKWYNVPSSSGNNVLNYVKGRIIAGLDNSVYELTGAGSPTLPTAKFTHFNTAYVFTGVTGVPSAIMVSGFAGTLSQIHKFTLDSTGALPVLSGGVVTSEMPSGELINDIFGYLGTFVGIATNKGVRVATTDTNGNLVYGPLVYQNSNGVQTIYGYDRFLYAGNNNNLAIPQQGFVNPVSAAVTSMLIKMDLSQITSTGSQPFSNDLDSHFQGNVLDCCNFGTSATAAGMLAFTVSGQGVFITDTSKKEASGLFFTSRIRYNTLEAKHFKYVYLRTQTISDGSIALSAIDPAGGNTSIISQGSGNSTSPILIGPEGNAQEWLQFEFMFNRGTSNNNVSPILNGYQLRALPGVDRQLLLTIPLSCHDFEEDKYGNPVGYDGASEFRLTALKSLIASGNLVLFQDLNYGTASLVIVDGYHFEQQSNEQPKASSFSKADSNARGGYILLECRQVS